MLRDVTLEDAVTHLASILSAPREESAPLLEASGRVLARDLRSLVDHPSVDDSALDGYAVRLEDTRDATPERPARLRVTGESPAGRPWVGRLEPGRAVKVFTGGAVPEGADGIAMVEHTRRDGEHVLVERPATPDIRRRGRDLREGETYLRRGTVLRARHVALAAAMGHARLPVLERPRVAVLPTGDELVEPGETLPPGGVYDSNRYGLAALLADAGATCLSVARAADDEGALRAALDSARGAHLLLTTGGVSMGERDLVRALLEREGRVVFWRVRLKPGGPPVCGVWGGDTPVFGLPGNPVSALVVFHVLVKPALHRAWGALEAPYEVVRATALTAFRGAGAKLHLPRCALESGPAGFLARALEDQSSGVLRSLVDGNALAVVPPGAEVRAGDAVDVIRL